MLKFLLKIVEQIVIGKTTGEEREEALNAIATILEAVSPDTVTIEKK